MKVSLRLSDADRAKYGGDEWVHINADEFVGVGYDRLRELERPIKRDDDMSLARILAIEWPDQTMLGIRAMVWLARQLCGNEKPAWSDFKPNVFGVTFKTSTGDDADPPVGGSSEPPSAKTGTARKTPSKKASRS